MDQISGVLIARLPFIVCLSLASEAITYTNCYTQQQQQQQQQPQHQSAHLNNSGNDYMRGHDAINNLQGNFSELNLNKPSGYQGASNQQSRLNQWKLPVLEKDDGTDFSRAPGATKQNLSSNSNNMGSLGLQNDGTWSTGRNIADGWPDPSSDNENKDWSVAQPTAAATAYTDLVQEFEPGKPWKGSQIKSIEDDPSITPGSVARSPLSINPTPKDADIFANTGKNSPTDLPPLSLSSSTWSFNPNQNFPSWSDNSQQCASTSELWTSPMNKASSRGPPPGLTTHANKSGNGVSGSTSTSSTIAGGANGWMQARSGVPTTNTTWTAGNTSWSSSWLLLKNLTAQIDGPTLRTLCMQHGPLVSFHLYLNQGIALCKYTTREEASKAQMALNNCVLGNTTIFAESPSENEVQNILQHLPQVTSSTNSAIGSSAGSSVGTATAAGGSSSVSSLSGNSSNGNGNGNSGGGPSGNSSVSGSNPSTSVANSNLLSTSGGSASNSGGAGGSATGPVGSTTVNSTSLNGSAGSGNSANSKSTTNNITMSGGQSGASGLTNSNSSTWRQTTQNQPLSGQSRPTGREADYDYISQFVCSIVDD